jgi:hypothetical protein
MLLINEVGFVRDKRKTMFHIIINSILYFTTIIIFVFLNYIDFIVVKIIYLPIFFIAIVAILIRQYIFGNIFIISAELGLTLEYIINLSQGYHPNMTGAFVNAFIICLGFIIGVMVQIFVAKVRRLK